MAFLQDTILIFFSVLFRCRLNLSSVVSTGRQLVDRCLVLSVFSSTIQWNTSKDKGNLKLFYFPHLWEFMMLVHLKINTYLVIDHMALFLSFCFVWKGESSIWTHAYILLSLLSNLYNVHEDTQHNWKFLQLSFQAFRKLWFLC